MRILNHILCLGVFTYLFSACLPTKMDGVGGKSGGSELRAQLPDPAKFSENPDIAKKITHYALKIDATPGNETCTSIPQKTETYQTQTDFTAKVQMGCDYQIKLEIGALQQSSNQMLAYYEGVVNLKSDQIKPDKTNVILSVNLTQAGSEAGFKNGEVKTPPIGGNSTDLSIDVKIGNGNGSTPTPNANGGNSGANGTGSKLNAEQILKVFINEFVDAKDAKTSFIRGCDNQPSATIQCAIINPSIQKAGNLTRNIIFNPSSTDTSSTYSYSLVLNNKTYVLKFELFTMMGHVKLIQDINNNKLTELKLKNFITTSIPNEIIGTYSPK